MKQTINTKKITSKNDDSHIPVCGSKVCSTRSVRGSRHETSPATPAQYTCRAPRFTTAVPCVMGTWRRKEEQIVNPIRKNGHSCSVREYMYACLCARLNMHANERAAHVCARVCVCMCAYEMCVHARICARMKCQCTCVMRLVAKSSTKKIVYA